MKTSYLYEGLDNKSKKSMMLWESAGRAIVEAQLTTQQIAQLFQQVEKDATAAGGNRTLVGKGKDVASAVNQAYQDLKSKVENSAVMQNFDQAYDQAAEKLKQATGGEQGVMQYVQKYRDFAKKHPIAQSLIYGALIAAAGISGAGAGGAAALGLLKMTDKLLQGEKFSRAAIKGAETGAMAYAAGQIGKALRGDQTTTTSSTSTSTQQGYIDSIPLKGSVHPDWLKQYPTSQFQYQWDGSEGWRVVDKASNRLMATFTSGTPPVDTVMPGVADNFESQQLTNDQVTKLFETIIVEAGLWDKFKTGLGQAGAKAKEVVGQQVQKIGHNITTKITADKLQKAWKSAGSPTDSDAIKNLLIAQGIDATIVDNSLKALNISPANSSRLPDISKMSDQQLQQLLQTLEQPSSTSAQPAQQPSMSQLLKQRQAQGLGAYESVDFGDLKTKLKEALTK